MSFRQFGAFPTGTAATYPATASGTGFIELANKKLPEFGEWFDNPTLAQFMNAGNNSNMYYRTILITELQTLPMNSLNELTKYFPKLIGPNGIFRPPNTNPPLIGGHGGLAPPVEAKRAAMAGSAPVSATVDPSPLDPKAESLGKISNALKPFADNCLKKGFVMVLADQSETARIMINDNGKTLVQVEDGNGESWRVLPDASAQDSVEADAEAEDWGKNFAGHVSSMIAQAETDITMDSYASAPSNRPVKKLLRIYGNDKVFHVTISTGSKSPSTIKYSYVEVQLPEEFAHFNIILARPLN
jgi:hypothetical protein